MEIVIKSSSELSQSDWESYVFGFNEVFNKTETIENFKHKYLNTIDDHSYHALLTNNNDIVGGCTVIPYQYNIYETTERIGLAVDVFIREQFRTDLMALYRMYKRLKNELISHGIVLVVAVPNDVSYPYWKNIVKWKDVGLLKYYAFPVKAGNVLKKATTFANFFSGLFSKFLLLISYFTNSSEKSLPVSIDRSDNSIEKQRYTPNHKIIKDSKSFFAYRVVNEEGLNACYLIDFYNTKNQKKDSQSLRKAIKYILQNEQTDIIIFVGKLNFFQFLLFKVPYKYEPKHLNFTADILIPEKISNTDFIYDISN
ncbi:MAG: hypothetical protein PHG08_08735, partial [Bacilli bacterium]|nr:hypothetical protein [Bacilli bacterium]